jgi:hypothetical protein
MQNEALLLAQSQADSATKNRVNYMIYYLRLFYLNKGDVLGLNLAGSELLGKNRFKLINSRFDFFQTTQSQF